METIADRLKSAASWPIPANKAFPKLVLPKAESYLTPSSEKITQQVWNEVYTESVLLNFASHENSMKRSGKIKGVEYREFLDEKGNFQRAFVTMKNPQKPGEYRLFEIPYQYFDADKVNGKMVRNSTGFKMCAFVEHKLKHGRWSEAEGIIDTINTHPDQRRELVTDDKGKPKVNMAFGGWTLEVGGGYNAYHIEHGELPLQWKNIIGSDGKNKAVEEAINALTKVRDSNGKTLDIRNGKAELSMCSNSMGSFNATFAKYLLKKQYGLDIKLENIVPMAEGNTLRQIVELEYNLRHHTLNRDYQSIDEIGKTAEGRTEAVAILEEIADVKNTRTVYNGNSYFAFYNVNGNASLNSMPALPGTNILTMNFETKPGFFSADPDSYVGHGLRIKTDHLLPGLNNTLAKGPSTLAWATYTPEYSAEELLFSKKPQPQAGVEQALIASLHGFLYRQDHWNYGSEGNFGERYVTSMVGTSQDRPPLGKLELYSFMFAQQLEKEKQKTAEISQQPNTLDIESIPAHLLSITPPAAPDQQVER